MAGQLASRHSVVDFEIVIYSHNSRCGGFHSGIELSPDVEEGLLIDGRVGNMDDRSAGGRNERGWRLRHCVNLDTVERG